MKNWIYQNFIIHQFRNLDSTNGKALEMIQSSKIFNKEVVVADSQNAGRGRGNRRWISPQGNLYLSLVIKHSIPIKNVFQLSFLSILALRFAIEKIFYSKNINATIENKWPNDLIINNKKVAGILIESKSENNICEFLVIGVGVNVDSSPDNTIFAASSLKDFEVSVEKEELMKLFLDEFDVLYQNWIDFGFENIMKAWLSKAYRIGKEITVSDKENKITGKFSSVNDDGSIVLTTKDGIVTSFACDVS